LLINVDDDQEDYEGRIIYDFGLMMGLFPGVIQHVLFIIHRYPNKIVPPEVLISIFKAHYN